MDKEFKPEIGKPYRVTYPGLFHNKVGELVEIHGPGRSFKIQMDDGKSITVGKSWIKPVD